MNMGGGHILDPNRNLRRVACGSKVLANIESLVKDMENSRIDCGILHIKLGVGREFRNLILIL